MQGYGGLEVHPQPQKTRRIFVARIPGFVTEDQFRGYFENYGRIDDAYMPRDHLRQSYRGIGFVTFADESSTERVMGVKHGFGGHEVIVDRATPKDGQSSKSQNTHGRGPMVEQAQFAAMGHQPHTNLIQDAQLTSLASALGLGSEGNVTIPPSQYLSQFESQMQLFQVLREQQQHMAVTLQPDYLMNSSQPQDTRQPAGHMFPMDLLPSYEMGSVSTGLSTLINSIPNLIDMVGTLPNPVSLDSNIEGSMRDSMPQSLDNGYHMVANVPHTAPSVSSSQGGDSSRVLKARNGPRLFVGKLSKETSEQDLRDHFTNFGYVMDVFVPRAKENKKEHRGFGFVTFETEAAIQRVVSHGTHKIRNHAVAIDVAVPEESGSVCDVHK